MAGLGAIGAIISAVGSLVGGVIAAQGQMQAAAAEQRNLNYQAVQLDMKAKEEQAAAQMKAHERKERGKLAMSRLRSLAASSGFDPVPTLLRLGGQIAERAKLQADMENYGGLSRRYGLEAEATGKRAQGVAIMQGARTSATGTIIGAATSAFGGLARMGGGFGSSNYVSQYARPG